VDFHAFWPCLHRPDWRKRGTLGRMAAPIRPHRRGSGVAYAARPRLLAMADGPQAASLSGRRIGLYLPRLSSPAAADQSAGHAGRRGLWLYHHAVEAGRRPQQGRRADPPGGDVWTSRARLSQRDLRCLQGQPPAAARRPEAPVPADSRCHPRLQPGLHRGDGARGGRHDRLLCPRRLRAGLGRDHRFVRQGPDAAGRPLRGRR
jgi:hypothetical protein